MDPQEKSMQASQKVAGWLLASGSVIFLIAAFIPIADRAGNLIFTMPLRDWPAVIRDNSTLWGWTGAMYILASMLALLGANLLSDALHARGETVFSRLAPPALMLGVLLWVLEVAFRIGFTTWAHEAATNNSTLDLFTRISGWLWVTFIVSSVLIVFSIAALGMAFLQIRLVSIWMGWLALGYALFATAYLLVTNDLPPFFHYVVLLVIGVCLLLPARPLRSRVAATQTNPALPTSR